MVGDVPSELFRFVRAAGYIGPLWSHTRHPHLRAASMLILDAVREPLRLYRFVFAAYWRAGLWRWWRTWKLQLESGVRAQPPAGSMLAGTEESPGVSVTRNGRQYKVYRGMASLWTSAERRDMPHEDELLSEIVPEGIEAMVPHRGKAAAVLTQLVGGLRSGMSYCGATTLAELRANARFIRVTDAGVREGMPHDVDPLS